MALPDAGDIARMTRIIDRLRSYGVEVREMPGWQTRGFRFPIVPVRIFDHHDASSRKSGEWGALGLILDGTPRGIPGPLSNFQVARCMDGKPRVAVIAAGYTYHAGTGGPNGPLPLNDANPRTYGVEKANDGLGEPYTAAANYATNALFHAAAVESGADPCTFPIGHKEWTSRKSDPLYSMADRRRQVATFTPEGDDMPLSDEDIRKIRHAVAEAPIGGTIIGRDPKTGKQSDVPLFVAMATAVNELTMRLNPRSPGDTGPDTVLGFAVSAHAEATAARKLAEGLTAKIDALAPTGQSGTLPAAAQIDYAALAKAINDDADRRARDGDSTTGPVT